MKAQTCYSQYEPATKTFKATWSVASESPFEATLMAPACNPGVLTMGVVEGYPSHVEARDAGLKAQAYALGLWKSWIDQVTSARGSDDFVKLPGELSHEAAVRELKALSLI